MESYLHSPVYIFGLNRHNLRFLATSDFMLSYFPYINMICLFCLLRRIKFRLSRFSWYLRTFALLTNTNYIFTSVPYLCTKQQWRLILNCTSKATHRSCLNIVFVLWCSELRHSPFYLVSTYMGSQYCLLLLVTTCIRRHMSSLPWNLKLKTPHVFKSQFWGLGCSYIM